MLFGFSRWSRATLLATWGAIGGAIGLFLLLLPTVQGIVPPVVGILVGMLIASFVAYGNLVAQHEQVQRQLESLRNARPVLRIEKVDKSRIALGTVFQEGTFSRERERYTVDVWQLWIVNEPATRSPDAVARKLAAQITFYDGEWREALSFVGQWAITRMPDHSGWREIRSEIDLSAVPARGKLLLINQTDGIMSGRLEPGSELVTRRCIFALAGENLHAYPQSADHHAYMLNPEIIRLRVTLSAENLEPQDFRFALDRQADGTINAITEIRG